MNHPVFNANQNPLARFYVFCLDNCHFSQEIIPSQCLRFAVS